MLEHASPSWRAAIMESAKETVVVYAPYARDGDSIVRLLTTHGHNAVTVTSLPTLVDHLNDDLGAVLMTEEALVQADWTVLLKAVSDQPSWSSYPFILLIGQHRSAGQTEAVYRLFPPEVANVMVLERPMSSTALLSALRWAVGGRRRQFVTRDHLSTLERNARHQKLLTRELAHRVKNTIAMLQSIVTQTMRHHSEMEPVRDLIIARFSALSRTHDLLLDTNFASADFPELVHRTLAVHDRRFEAEGPSIEISPQAALSFALVLHELATNAIKYGAFSEDAASGRVKLSWSINADSTPKSFEFSWIERGGPQVAAPERSGFGSRLIRTTLGALGSVETLYPPEGLEIRFSGSLTELTHSLVPVSVADDEMARINHAPS
ncbi:MAG: sensor histidine kinase [Alphaproteobacteria bacterium]|nr:MAG: sensor histidine kinase [Alphaproteobacteria bacterium]